MITETLRYHTYRCPYCFTDFQTCETSDPIDVECQSCGHPFTLGEARRGRPDPIPDPAIARLTSQIAELLDRVIDLENRLSQPNWSDRS